MSAFLCEQLLGPTHRDYWPRTARLQELAHGAAHAVRAHEHLALEGPPALQLHRHGPGVACFVKAQDVGVVENALRITIEAYDALMFCVCMLCCSSMPRMNCI